ncbi:MAG: patatin-like phospholipase family protein [Alphaproteobacteria bacterium]|nr:patatin-like phospholipase family protein [Alphaproteobacteria bacterium]
MSGGGKRSASFSYGALKGLRELVVPTVVGPRSLLSEVDAIAGVSGGSFTAAYYGLHRQATFGRYEHDFLYRDTEANIFGIYLLPWNWTWLIDPTVGTNDFMERVYDREMFHGARYADLKELGRPLVAVGATDIAFGTPFLFTQDTFDLICSDLDDFPIARAVAASNGFPGLFSPITLTNHAAACGGRQPGWLRRVTEAQRDDPRSRIGSEARNAERYLDSQRVKYVHLVDGGVADNLAMRAAGAEMQAIAQLNPQTKTARLERVRRVLVLSIDGQGSADTSVAQRRVVGGIFSLFGLVAGVTIDRFNFETLQTVDQQLREFVVALKQTRCAQASRIDGIPCEDVDGELIHVSLTGLPESPEREQLLAIRTGLTLRRDDVDRLIEAGRSGILHSPQLRNFLDNYAPATPLATSAPTAMVSQRRRAGS